MSVQNLQALALELDVYCDELGRRESGSIKCEDQADDLKEKHDIVPAMGQICVSVDATATYRALCSRQITPKV